MIKDLKDLRGKMSAVTFPKEMALQDSPGTLELISSIMHGNFNDAFNLNYSKWSINTSSS